jgi:eukaryotic-like serine/threonine-protein kinase
MFDTGRIGPTRAVLVALLLVSLILCGCYGPRGWPGTQTGTQAGKDTLFVSTMEGRVLSLNPDSGARRWEWEPQKQAANITSFFSSCSGGGQFRAGLFYAAPAVANGTVYVGYHTGMIYAIDGDRGTQVWSRDIKGKIASGLTAVDDTVFVGSSNGKLSALYAGNGSVKWEFLTQNEVWASPTIVDGIIYFGSLDHNLYALNESDGTKKWVFETGGGIASPPLVVDGVVYIGSFDRKLYAVDAETGTAKWFFDGAGDWFWSQALYHDGVVYACSFDHKVYALYVGNGTPAWPKPYDAGSLLKSSPVVVGGVLVVASEEGKVFGLDLSTGEQKWQFDDIEAKVLSPLCTDGDKVYINSQDNRLYALEGGTGLQAWNVSLAK